jgi:hypothetical protein
MSSLLEIFTGGGENFFLQGGGEEEFFRDPEKEKVPKGLFWRTPRLHGSATARKLEATSAATEFYT